MGGGVGWGGTAMRGRGEGWGVVELRELSGGKPLFESKK